MSKTGSRRPLAAATVGLVLAFAACGGGDGAENTILVFAAASLTDAFDEIETAFEAANPETDVRVNAAGSSTLREQILEGAPADVFASANESVMAELVDEGSIASSIRLFAGNRLRIAVPAGNPGGVGGLDDFGRDELLIGLCAEGVPCGSLARTALSDADIDPAIDTNEPDVRALLTRIAADELDAGIVYVTDVRSAGDRVEGIDLPPDVEATAPYPIAVVDGAPNPDGAEAVIDFVLSPDGQAILAAAGFETP